MENLPAYIGIIFSLVTLITVLLFYKASNYSTITLYILTSWLLVQGIIGYSEFYTVTNVMPPRFVVLIAPPFLFIALLFLTTKGRIYLDSLDTNILTLLHTIRIPVEIILFWLFLADTIPQLMTFEGRNFDIIAGITAPIIYYFGYRKKLLNNTVLIIWNVVCSLLLLNIVINAVLSAPFPFQQFAFDQPNIAVLYFPFVWLPSCIVPLVFLSHFACIRNLLRIQ
jgi:hypothetical protein